MISTVSSMVVADERVRRKSRGLHQRVLGCSGTSLWNIQKDEHGDFVRGGDSAANAFELKARAVQGTPARCEGERGGERERESCKWPQPMLASWTEHMFLKFFRPGSSALRATDRVGFSENGLPRGPQEAPERLPRGA